MKSPVYSDLELLHLLDSVAVDPRNAPQPTYQEQTLDQGPEPLQPERNLNFVQPDFPMEDLKEWDDISLENRLDPEKMTQPTNQSRTNTRARNATNYKYSKFVHSREHFHCLIDCFRVPIL
mmetsp:Transcript_26443/g.40761  ORF Transcript_26443/g.40761 Transcript_26443/m.40761 type:complete len:121 (+) Transcript_26443:7-369(+)